MYCANARAEAAESRVGGLQQELAVPACHDLGARSRVSGGKVAVLALAHRCLQVASQGGRQRKIAGRQLSLLEPGDARVQPRHDPLEGRVDCW